MPWFKVDDKFHSSRKLNSIPKRHRLQAAGLWAVAGSWVSGESTDGFVPDYMIETWGPTEKTVESLVNAGLWECVRGGFVFRSWLEYNPSKAQTEAERAASAERMRKSRERRRDECAGSDDKRDDVAAQRSEELQRNTQEALQRPDPTRPDPTNKKKERAEYGAEFEDWWKHYPRKADKGHAAKAYRAARKTTDAETLVRAAIAFARTVADADPKFIPYPGKWLNGQQWLDEDIAPADPESIRGWLGDCWKQADTKSVEERSGLTFRHSDASPAEDEDITAFNRRMRQQWIADHHDEIIRRIMAREASAA